MNNEKRQEEYNLYTEKIVEPRMKKYKKLLRVCKHILYVSFLAVIAGVVFAFVTNNMVKKRPVENNDSHEVTLAIPDEETKPSESKPQESKPDETGKGPVETESDSKQIAIKEYEDFFKTAKDVSDTVCQGLVVVSAQVNTSQIFGTVYEKSTTGAIIVSDNDTYYVLTQYDVVRNADDIVLTLNTGDTCSASLLGGDAVTNIAILSFNASQINEKIAKKIAVLPLGNSNFVGKSQPLVAVGNICNGYYTMNYGIATNLSNIIYDIDSSYGIINTNISCSPGSNGILVDTKGRLVGVITNNYNDQFGWNMISAYGITHLKNIIEQISNEKNIVYIGIMGREITNEISDKFVLPKGIYIENILANSPAFAAGLQNGDIITKINSAKVETFMEYRSAIFEYNSADVINVTVARRGNGGYKEITYQLTLAEKK